MKLHNIIANFFKKKYWKVITKKVWIRFTDIRNGGIAEVRKWYDENSINFDELLLRTHDSLLREAINWDADFQRQAKGVLENIDVKLGGGGNCALLYYLVRKSKPNVVLETGVAAGFSSKSILAAQEQNGFGELYSSDFPYFRLKNPEHYIGILVDNALRDRWHLFIDGDEINLPQICRILGSRKISLFHYDSDKSYLGRAWALSFVKPLLENNALIVFDDIVDNSHFKDTVSSDSKIYYRIIKHHGKLVGVLSRNEDLILSLFGPSKLV